MEISINTEQEDFATLFQKKVVFVQKVSRENIILLFEQMSITWTFL